MYSKPSILALDVTKLLEFDTAVLYKSALHCHGLVSVYCWSLERSMQKTPGANYPLLLSHLFTLEFRTYTRIKIQEMHNCIVWNPFLRSVRWRSRAYRLNLRLQYWKPLGHCKDTITYIDRWWYLHGTVFSKYLLQVGAEIYLTDYAPWNAHLGHFSCLNCVSSLARSWVARGICNPHSVSFRNCVYLHGTLRCNCIWNLGSKETLPRTACDPDTCYRNNGVSKKRST